MPPACLPFISGLLPGTHPSSDHTHRFDTVYADKRIRVAKDIRGDVLVVARDGPPRDF